MTNKVYVNDLVSNFNLTTRTISDALGIKMESVNQRSFYKVAFRIEELVIIKRLANDRTVNLIDFLDKAISKMIEV